MDPPAPFCPGATRRVRNHVRVGVGVVVRECIRRQRMRLRGGGDGNDGENDIDGEVKGDEEYRLWAGVRKGSHGHGLLALPGGHLEMYESWELCAFREVMEEMDVRLDMNQTSYAHVTNDVMKSEEKHYVTIFVTSCYKCKCCRTDDEKNVKFKNEDSEDENEDEGACCCTKPKNMEPNKCCGWEAYRWGELRDMVGQNKLFGPLERLVRDEPESVLKFLRVAKQKSKMSSSETTT